MPGDEPGAASGSAPRLRRSSEIHRVRTTGERLQTGRVIVFIAPGSGRSRAAWVAGRRIGGAVARNRARRLLREAWRAVGPRVEHGHELVMMARRRMDDVKAHQVIEELEDLLERRGVLR